MIYDYDDGDDDYMINIAFEIGGIDVYNIIILVSADEMTDTNMICTSVISVAKTISIYRPT